jgi:hypothetical protein
MTTTPTDELAMPHFEEQLWAEIRAHHEAGAWTRPAAARDRVPAMVAGRPAIHRRAARRSLAAAAALAVIAAAGALSSIGGDEGTGRGSRPESSDAPAAGDIETRTIAAIDEALADSIIHTVGDVGGHEVWYDGATRASRTLHRDRDRRPLWEVGPAVAPLPDDQPGAAVASRQINHCSLEYAEVASFRLTELPASDPATIRDRLADGTLVADGTEVVDGQDLIRLVEATPASPSRDIIYYVDPDTYRPVLVRLSPTEADPGDDVPSIQPETIRFAYLSRTAENLALLAPPIPDGYTRVTDTAGGFTFLTACD